MEPPVTLEQYRMSIDNIDEKITELLKERFCVSARIGEYKKKNNIPVTDSGREDIVKAKLRERCGDGPSTERIVSIYEEIMAESRLLQRKILGNYYIIGMPGCGKSTVGKELAARLGRTFIDADDFFEETVGETPADVITSKGEKDFREKESEILRTLRESTDSVIALGGGAVTVPANREILGGDCLIIYLTRELDRLETKGRPLSASVGVKELYEARHSIYEAWADMTVKNDDDPGSTVDSIIRKL